MIPVRQTSHPWCSPVTSSTLATNSDTTKQCTEVPKTQLDTALELAVTTTADSVPIPLIPSSASTLLPRGPAVPPPVHLSTPVSHFPSARQLQPHNLSQALSGGGGDKAVILPPHPPYSPLHQYSFVFPPGQHPADQLPSLHLPVFPNNTVRVITPNPNSRDSTITRGPEFALFDNFGLLRSRTPSIEWDNYSEDPSFNNSDQDWGRQRLLTTDPNFLDSCDQLNNPIAEVFEDISLDTSEDTIMEDVSREIGRLTNLRSNLIRRMKMYTHEDVVADTVHEVEQELKTILISLDEYSNGVDTVLAGYKEAMGEAMVQQYEADLLNLFVEVKRHKRQVMDKQKEVSPPPTHSTYETEMLRLQLRSLNLQESALGTAESDKKEKRVILAETTSNEFYGETSVMGDLLMEENWDLADNTTVSQGMRALSAWQAQMNVIERKYRAFENEALKHTFPETKTEAVDAEYSRIRAKFEAVKEAVVYQDKERGLFTLEPVKTEKVKWPVFYGNPSEDFMKWKEKMELAFLKNRVPRDERLDKLREHLRSKALALVPESTKDISAAYSVLKEAFGDPARVLDHKLKTLDDLGPFPSDRVGRGLPGYGKQVDWLLQVEGIIRDIIELGEEYVELDRDAFSTATLKKILERFPEKVVARFNRLKGDGKAKLKGFQTQLAERRSEVQGLDNTYGGAVGGSVGGGPGGLGYWQ